ncbi:MAG: hypothetical protein WBI53_14060 [Paludibacter sp.]
MTEFRFRRGFLLPESELRHPAFAAGKTRPFLAIIPTQCKRTAAVETSG